MRRKHTLLTIGLLMIMLLSSCSTGSKLALSNRCLKGCSEELNIALRAECYTMAIEKGTGNPLLYFKRGKTYQELFKFTLAMTDFIKVVELEPGNREACYALASVAAINYHKEYALHWLEKAIDAGYNNYQVIINDPSLENIRETEKFKVLLKEKCVNTVSYK